MAGWIWFHYWVLSQPRFSQGFLPLRVTKALPSTSCWWTSSEILTPDGDPTANHTAWQGCWHQDADSAHLDLKFIIGRIGSQQFRLDGCWSIFGPMPFHLMTGFPLKRALFWLLKGCPLFLGEAPRFPYPSKIKSSDWSWILWSATTVCFVAVHLYLTVLAAAWAK